MAATSVGWAGRVLTREERSELLALAGGDPLRSLADAVLATCPPPVVLDGPTVGTAPCIVREPVQSIRFALIDVLVTRAEVELEGSRGWAMRLGDDRLATLAAAVCDAEVERHGPLAGDVLALCALTAHDDAERRSRQWAELNPTIVSFEELD